MVWYFNCGLGPSYWCNSLLMLHHLLIFHWTNILKIPNVRLYFIFTLNMHTNFYFNWMLFTKWSINSCSIHNFEIQKIWIKTFYKWHSYRSLDYGWRQCNLKVNMWNYSSNAKLLSGVNINTIYIRFNLNVTLPLWCSYVEFYGRFLIIWEKLISSSS